MIDYLLWNRLIEEGGDWDRRNRLKVYQGIYFLSIRDFKSAANNFLDSISTFTSYELMDYKTFVTYTVLASMIALERVDLRTKVGYEYDMDLICLKWVSWGYLVGC